MEYVPGDRVIELTGCPFVLELASAAAVRIAIESGAALASLVEELTIDDDGRKVVAVHIDTQCASLGQGDVSSPVGRDEVVARARPRVIRARGSLARNIYADGCECIREGPGVGEIEPAHIARRRRRSAKGIAGRAVHGSVANIGRSRVVGQKLGHNRRRPSGPAWRESRQRSHRPSNCFRCRCLPDSGSRRETWPRNYLGARRRWCRCR